MSYPLRSNRSNGNLRDAAGLRRPISVTGELSLVVRVGGLACVLAVISGCGGSSPVTPSPPQQPEGPGAPPPPAITVTASGVSPRELIIDVGSRVRFINQDTQQHYFGGGPDPTRPDCPQIDRAGPIASGQSRDTFVFETARTCQYHDHFHLGVPAFEGRIVIR